MKHFIYLFVALLSYSTASQAQYQEGLDPYFGTKGIVTHSETTIQASGFTDALLQPDGKIVAGTRVNIARFNSDGTLDKSFGTDGVFNEPIYYFNGSSFIKLTALFWISARLLLQPDGKIIGMGEAYIPAPFRMVLMIRLLPDGSLDPTFGRNGIVCDTLLGNLKNWQTASLLPDGKILAVGKYSFGDYYPIFVRYKSNGIIDSSFGINGKVIDPVVHSPMGDVTVMPDGKILVLLDYFGVGRYLPDGSADTTFNHVGYNNIFSGFAAPFSHAMALRPDGKIWIAGHTLFGTPTTFILGRFNANGSIDSTFNGIGYREYPTDTGAENKVRDMLLLPDGKVVLGGRVMNRATKQYNFGLMRIHPDGREDSTFGINGRLLTQMNMTAPEGSADPEKLLLQSDNKIVALGYSANTFDPTALSTIVRYYPNGKTSIQNLPHSAEANIYPNPASDKVNITLSNYQKLEQISIYSMDGKLVQSWTSTPISNTIDVSNLSNGVYFISITIDGITSHQKIIIQH